LFVKAGTDLEKLSKRTQFISRRTAQSIKGIAPTEEGRARGERISRAIRGHKAEIEAKRAETHKKHKTEQFKSEVHKAREQDVKYRRSSGKESRYKRTLSKSSKMEYWRVRRRKLAGQWIDDGEWHGMMDIARALNDPALKDLMKS
jgi:hypothetical protein